MTPVLYYLAPSPPCRMILLLAKLLSLEMDMKVVNVLAGEQMKPEFIQMNPQHTVPTIDDQGLILWESRAIMSYLVSAYGKEDDPLYPKDVRARAVVDQRLQFDLGTLSARMLDYYFPTIWMGAPLDEAKKAKLREAIGWLDAMLKGHDFAAGDQFTIADIALLVTMSQVEAFGMELNEYGRIKPWLLRCKEIMEPHDYHEINGSQAMMLADMFHTKLQKMAA